MKWEQYTYSHIYAWFSGAKFHIVKTKTSDVAGKPLAQPLDSFRMKTCETSVTIKTNSQLGSQSIYQELTAITLMLSCTWIHSKGRQVYSNVTYLYLAAADSHGALFHVSERNHFASWKPQMVGAPRIYMAAAFNISFHLPLFFCLLPARTRCHDKWE